MSDGERWAERRGANRCLGGCGGYGLDGRVVQAGGPRAGLIRGGSVGSPMWWRMRVRCTEVASVMQAMMQTVSAIGWVAAVRVHRASVRSGSVTARSRTRRAERRLDGCLPARSGPRVWFCSRRLRDVKRLPVRSEHLTLAPYPPPKALKLSRPPRGESTGSWVAWGAVSTVPVTGTIRRFADDSEVQWD